ncbi:hypothetical protein LCGC14_0353170 [marine sediment metagenome]|uniref:Uncharacterized protein n=1 Tax=marine sediment metagenome TaxID=412755 RepID=A0A0F9TA16_9ZZZZ
MKYRKKPIVVEAEQYVHPDDNVDGVIPRGSVGCANSCPDSPHIHTLEGPLHVSLMDWIITGIKGEKYPCKPDIFDATYEKVE